MRPIEKLISKFQIDTNPNKDRQILEELLRAREKSKHETRARISTRSKIAAISAAAVLVVLTTCLLTVSDKGELPQPLAGGTEIAVISKTPAEMVSVFSLNMAFRDGGIEAVTKQFQQAHEKVKPGLKERLTIDQLVCE